MMGSISENLINSYLMALGGRCTLWICSIRRLVLSVRTMGLAEAADLILSYSFSLACSLSIDGAVGDVP